MTLPKAAAALLNDQASVGLLLYAISTIFAAGMNTCAKLLSRQIPHTFDAGNPLVIAAGTCIAVLLLLSLLFIEHTTIRTGAIAVFRGRGGFWRDMQ